MSTPMPTYPGTFWAGGDVVAEAVGLVAVVIDERVAQELLHEDVVFLRGAEPVHSADMLQGLRHFLPYEVRALELEALEQIAASGSAIAPELRTAARWYLKGAQAGPVADAVIYFWVALEALTPGEQQSVKSLETMLVEAGWNMEDGDPELGKMAGLRADIVHDAVEDPARIREGYYRLEATVRVLLRRGLNVTSSWPAAASTPTFVNHSDEIEASRVAWTVEWHDEMPSPDPAVTTPDLEWAVMQAPPLTAGFEIAVDADVAPHWIRKIELDTAMAAMMLEDAFDGADLDVVVEDFPAWRAGNCARERHTNLAGDQPLSRKGSETRSPARSNAVRRRRSTTADARGRVDRRAHRRVPAGPDRRVLLVPRFRHQWLRCSRARALSRADRAHRPQDGYRALRRRPRGEPDGARASGRLDERSLDRTPMGPTDRADPRRVEAPKSCRALEHGRGVLGSPRRRAG
jgi:hypothetical protein